MAGLTVAELTEALTEYARATATAGTHNDRVQAAADLHERLTGEPPAADDEGEPEPEDE